MLELWPPKILLYSFSLATVYQLSSSEIILIIGAVVYAFLLFKGQKGKVLRDQNKDLIDRNIFLESEHTRIKFEQNEAASEQDQLRHDLRNEIAALKSQLEIEQAKHDMSIVGEKLEAALLILNGREEMFKRMAAGISEIASFSRRDHTGGSP